MSATAIEVQQCCHEVLWLVQKGIMACMRDAGHNQICCCQLAPCFLDLLANPGSTFRVGPVQLPIDE